MVTEKIKKKNNNNNNKQVKPLGLDPPGVSLQQSKASENLEICII